MNREIMLANWTLHNSPVLMSAMLSVFIKDYTCLLHLLTLSLHWTAWISELLLWMASSVLIFSLILGSKIVPWRHSKLILSLKCKNQISEHFFPWGKEGEILVIWFSRHFSSLSHASRAAIGLRSKNKFLVCDAGVTFIFLLK